MAYIFRLHRDGTNINTDWSATNDRYGKNVIEHIQEPNENNTTRQITSIPSPFARIDLIKTAFKEVNDHNRGVDADTIYHKMVSDTLDVAEIFFNYDRLKDKFDILTWSINDLDNLSPQLHGDVIGTLDMFYNQDAATYHFNRNDEFYILRYKGPRAKTRLDVVGATSPSTLFFTPANDLSYISEEINFGQDHPFDASCQPLYKRDFEFVKYLCLFRLNYDQSGTGSFANDFPEINDYLDKNIKLLDNNTRTQIINLQIGDLANYQPLQIGNNTITILGSPWHKKTTPTNIQSDFEIVSNRYQGRKPLVLPCESGSTYRNFHYVQAAWGSNAAPYNDPEFDLSRRTLPHDGTPYPYLTVGDFLEDTIYRYDERLKKCNYYFGEWNNPRKSVLLPLKPRFFDFFSVDELINGVNGLKLLEIKDEDTNIRVKLSIPIKGRNGNGDYIMYVKNYFSSKNDSDETRGLIVDLDDSIGFAMMPLVKFTDPNTASYRVGLTKGFSEVKDYSLSFYSCNNSQLDNVKEIDRNKDDDKYSKLRIYCVDNNIVDYIRVNTGNDKGGVIVPIMKKEDSTGTKRYNFAIDFGTTNTHIEYTSNELTISKSFDITNDDIQLNWWSNYKDSSAATASLFESEFLPEKIGVEEEFHFPTRTALSALKSINWDVISAMGDNNFVFTYGYRLKKDFDQILTDLKWGNDNRQVRAAVYNLMFLIRNKVILNGGNLSNTKIVWFYPASMTRHKRDLFENVWTDAYRQYFGNNVNANVIRVTEAVAPYLYYNKEKDYEGTNTRMVNIDIGGGTTDVIFAENGEIKGSTSFRFAANSIFGGGYAENGGGVLNGLIKEYQKFFTAKFTEHGLGDCSKIQESLKNAPNPSANLASFYFSLIDNKDVKSKGLVEALDWNKQLVNDEYYKIIFVIFYSAIIYHVAKIMKIKNFEMPRHISFSGNGSKVVSIISNNTELLAKYTKNIFCHAYEDKEYHKDGLSIILKEDPKVATSKGGLSCLEKGKDTLRQLEDIEKIVLVGDKIIVENDVTGTYNGMDEKSMKSKTISEIEDLFEFINKVSKSLSDDFGVNAKLLKEITSNWNQDIENFFNRGLEKKRSELEGYDDASIEETFLFYPIIGMLYRISNQIYESKNKQN